MNELHCNQSRFFLLYAELKDLRSTFIANCIFNTLLIYTTIMLNIVTIYTIHKTSTMARTLRTLLLSLACSDVAVGLFCQPLYTFFLVRWLLLGNPGCHSGRMMSILSSFFSAASFGFVVAVSVDRFLAVHLHLRYQELVTHKRAVIVVIGIWVYSAFVSSMTLWGFPSTRSLILSVTAVFGFIITFVVYIRIYLTVRRHKNQIQSMQIRDEAHSDEIKKFAILIKSTVGIFYVYLVLLSCCSPIFISFAITRVYGSSIASKQFFLYSLTLMFLNSSLNPVIYCWKMKDIRHAISDILRKMSWNRNRPFRVNYNRSSRVAQVDD